MYMLIFLVAVAIISFVLLKKPNSKKNTGDVHDLQLGSMKDANFKSRAVMNVSEGKLYDFLLLMIQENNYSLRVFPQVSLGEILRSNKRSAFFAINSKRVDFVIANTNNMPCAVVEYQGAGHWNNNAKKRDAIKKMACENAGIQYFDIPATYTENDLKPLIDFFDSIKEK